MFSNMAGVLRPMQWTKCSVHLPDDGQLPDGSYFLYTDDGKVHLMQIEAVSRGNI